MPVAFPAAIAQWASEIHEAASATGLQPSLIGAVIESESGGRADIVSPAGAIGLMQLLPSTAADLGVDPWDPAQNIAGGSRYLAQQLARFGDVSLALAAYNAGPGAVAHYGGIPPYRETQQYVTRVLGAQARMRDEDGSPGTSRAPLGDARLAWLLLGGVGLLLLVLAAGTE